MINIQKIKAVAFDLDGTLVDSAPGLTQALQKMLRELDLAPITEKQVINWIGNGVEILIERAFDAFNVKPTNIEFSHAVNLFNQYYNDELNKATILFPHVKMTLDRLFQKNYKMALVTNKPAVFLPDLLTSLGIKHYFSLILGAGDTSQLKPHPAPLYQVFATLGLHGSEVLFVGDSKNDIQAAKHAHCPVVGMTYGYNYGELITKSNPDFVLDDFQDILTLLSISQHDNKNKINECRNRL